MATAGNSTLATMELLIRMSMQPHWIIPAAGSDGGEQAKQLWQRIVGGQPVEALGSQGLRHTQWVVVNSAHVVSISQQRP